MSMDGMTMKDKCDSVQVCSIMHVVRVYVRRVIHVVHNGLTVVEGVLVVVHTFYVAISVAICS